MKEFMGYVAHPFNFLYQIFGNPYEKELYHKSSSVIMITQVTHYSTCKIY